MWEKKKHITKFCDKVSIKVNFRDLNYKSHIYKIKTMTNFYKYPSKNIHKILNYKTTHIFPN